MRHQQTRSARQYARPGCCYDLPIEINDDEKNTTTITRTRPISTHTATWLEAKARDRWQATTTATAESTFTNTAMGIEEKGGDNWRDSGNRSTIQAESSQRCRKRAFADVGDDGDEVNGGGKRLRRPGMGMAGSEDRPNQDIPHKNPQTFLPSNRSHFNNQALLANQSHLTSRSHLPNQSRLINQPHLTNQSHPVNRSHLTKFNGEGPVSDLAELEASLRMKQRDVDLERATIKNIQRAEEQARIQEEEKKAHEAEMRERSSRFKFQSSLHQMWHDCDRDREAVEERRKSKEREEREAMKRRELQAEQEKLHELSSMESKLQNMWEAHDLARGMPGKIRPGQLSEAGQRRARERAEKLRHQNQ